MLKSIHRLSTKQFMEVMEKGRIYTSPLFVMRVLANKELGDQRVGPTEAESQKLGAKTQDSRGKQKTGGISTVAPKKVAATAVLRNKLRRQIYSAVLPIHSNLIKGISVIIFAKKETIGSNLKDMTTDLKNLFVKAKISV